MDARFANGAAKLTNHAEIQRRYGLASQAGGSSATRLHVPRSRDRPKFAKGHNGKLSNVDGVVADPLEEMQNDLGLRDNVRHRAGLQAHDQSQRVGPMLPGQIDRRVVHLVATDRLLVHPISVEERAADLRHCNVGRPSDLTSAVLLVPDRL